MKCLNIIQVDQRVPPKQDETRLLTSCRLRAVTASTARLGAPPAAVASPAAVREDPAAAGTAQPRASAAAGREAAEVPAAMGPGAPAAAEAAGSGAPAAVAREAG